MSLATFFMSKNSTTAVLHTDLPGSVTQRSWPAVPDASTVAGDWHFQTATGSTPFTMTGFPFRSISQFNRNSADRTYTLPAHITTPPTNVVAGTAPYVTLTSSWGIQSAEYNDFWSLFYTPDSGPVSSITVSGTSGYFGSGPVQLNLPAFGASFNASWGMQQGIPVTWFFIASGGTAWSVGTSPQALEGAVSTTAAVRGVTFTP